ncbi:MAG: mercuric reductase [Elusimicrobia bacterium]|nr:mercuric reductase [Elusimicrobiota bacterium]
MIIEPFDEHNRTVVANVHPPAWVNPRPADRYNLVVIGAGTAGLVTAAGAAGLGAKVALVEKHLLGGDCLNVGCVPSKALIRAARACADARDAGEYGVRVPPGTTVDFPKVMERMRRLRAALSRNDSVQRFKDLGVDVFLGQGKFVSPDSLEVDGERMSFSKAVIAAGARAARLPIPGLWEAQALTNETVFGLTELPKRLLVIGAGPIGVELAQAFARFGSRVTLFEAMHGVLPREDADASELIRKALGRDKVEFLCCVEIERVDRRDGERVVRFKSKHGPSDEAVFDAVLVGVGRSPNVEGLGLEAAGVDYDKAGVKVDERLRTSNPKIYAAGDICSAYKFTHAADAMARIAIQNALFLGRKRAGALTIPWCTYTDPEIAHVGLYEKDAKDKGIPVETFVQEFRDVDRAVLDGESEGFVKVHVRKGTDHILGATIVARHAGEMISEITLAMTAGVGLKAIAQIIHPYPTQAECIKKVADAYSRTRLTPFVKDVLERWLRWNR